MNGTMRAQSHRTAAVGLVPAAASARAALSGRNQASSTTLVGCPVAVIPAWTRTSTPYLAGSKRSAT